MTRGVAVAYLGIWIATGAGVIVELVCGVAVMRVGAPHDPLQATVDTAATLLLHNALVALWPLALAMLAWNGATVTRHAADALVTAQLVLHGAVVGGAVGQHHTMWRYLPHLPLEWLGLALPAAGWMQARSGAPSRRWIAKLAIGSLATLFAAACVETWAVPI